MAEDLVTGIDRSQLEVLFHTHYEAIRNYIYYKCGNMDVSEDIAQETFLKVWERKETIRKESIKALLYTIAGNLFNNRHHHEKVVLKFASSYQHPGGAEGPDFQMEYLEFKEQLEQSLSELSEKNREVFLMNRIDKMTYKEIAEQLGISVKAVEKRMNKALVTLRSRLDGKI